MPLGPYGENKRPSGLFIKLEVGFRYAVKRRATAVTIYEQHALGDKKERRYKRTDDIAEVDIGELECT